MKFLAILQIKINFWYIYGRYDLYLIAYPNDFWHKRKFDHFDPYNVFLAIATNIPVLLMTGFVVQGHVWNSDVRHVN